MNYTLYSIEERKKVRSFGVLRLRKAVEKTTSEIQCNIMHLHVAQTEQKSLQINNGTINLTCKFDLNRGETKKSIYAYTTLPCR